MANRIDPKLQASKARQGETRGTAGPAADTPKPAGFPPRFPDRKISETILDFAAPAFGHLPPEPPLETFRQMMLIVIAVWNFGSMSFSIWEKQRTKDYVAEWDRMMRRADPQARALFEELLRRRASEPFKTDQRAVGEWSVVATGPKGQFNFRCEARIPQDAS